MCTGGEFNASRQLGLGDTANRAILLRLDANITIHEVSLDRLSDVVHGLIHREDAAEVVLVELMACTGVDEDLAHEAVGVSLPVGMLGEVQNSKPASKVALIGVMLNVGEDGDEF